MKRLMVALAAMVVAVGLIGTATASAQTQEDTDFSGGTPDANTGVVPPGDLALSPTFDISEDFDGDALPTGWEGVPWEIGGSATVASDVLTVDGARANTTALYSPGRSLDFAATFSGQAFQHLGFGDTLGNAQPWAMFSTGGGSLPVGFYARTLGASGQDTALPPAVVDPLEEHAYSIEWTPTAVRYFVDGDLVATHAIAITQQMRPIASDAGTGGGSVQVDFLDLYSYPASGTFTSRVFDAGDPRATWRTLNGTPPGTPVAFEVSTGTTPTPDASWTDFQPVGPAGEISSPVDGRYLQYRATLTTTDASVTPFLEGVTLGYDIDSSAPVTTIGDVTVDGTTARATFSSEPGASFECSLDNAPYEACTSPKEYTGLSAGSHTVRMRGIDQVGNVGPAAERTFSIASVTPVRPVTPADTTAPKVRPNLSSVKVSRTGRFTIRVRCPSIETSCRIVLMVRYRGKTVARKGATLVGGDTERVTLRLNRRTRTALQASRRIRVGALTTARDAAGNSATTRTRLSLRAPGRG